MIVAFIQARLGSKRFNSKMLSYIDKLTVIQMVYERVKKSKLLNNVYVIIPEIENDFKRYLELNDMKYLSGDSNDVLNRYYECNQIVKADHIVRITGDCPFIDFKTIDILIKKHLKEKNDYTANNFFDNCTFPDGLDCEIITRGCLNQVWKLADGKHREHVTSFIREKKMICKYASLKSKYGDYSKLRLTIDYEDDLQLLNEIYKRLKENFTYSDIIKLYKKESNLFEKNLKYKRDESYHAK